MLNTVKRFDADVVICGGGCAGFTAGVAAARAGKRTILLEMRESLGGLFTNGYITGAAGCIDGLGKEFYDRLNKQGDVTVKPHQPVIEPEKGKVMMEQMLLKAGCRILYGTHVVDCEVENNKITKVIAYCKSGKIEISGKIFIDGTGDADLAFAAGVPTEISNAEYLGLNSAATMGFRLSYVNIDKYQEASREWMKTHHGKGKDSSNLLIAKEYEALENGDIHEILTGGFIIFDIPVGHDRTCTDVTLDATHTFDTHGDDVVDLTRQIVDQHNKVLEFVAFMKKYLPGYENVVLANFAPMNGVRDSRRIVGEYILKAEDLAAARKWDDGIAQFAEPFDTHVPTPGTQTAIRHIHSKEPIEPAICRPMQDEKDKMLHPFVTPDLDTYEVRTNPREYSEIPFRSLVAIGVDNLMAVGRCYSADFHAICATRIIGTSMSMGQAAGTAAALALDEGVAALRDLDGAKVKAQLIKDGCGLDHAPDGYWKAIRESKNEPIIMADMAILRP